MFQEYTRSGQYCVRPYVRPDAVIDDLKAKFYCVVSDTMEPPYLAELIGLTKDIEHERKSWDFDGCEQFEMAKSDFLGWQQSTEWYRETGSRNRRGLILSGPPGTGKTIIARAIARMAVELGIPVIAVNHQFDAVTLKSIIGNTRVVIIIDEMERFEEDLPVDLDILSNCFVIGTTNELGKMHDRIIRRPGRFDRIISVDRMTPGVIRNICKKYRIESCYSAIEAVFPTVTPAQLAEISFRVNILKVDPDTATLQVKQEFSNGR